MKLYGLHRLAIIQADDSGNVGGLELLEEEGEYEAAWLPTKLTILYKLVFHTNKPEIYKAAVTGESCARISWLLWDIHLPWKLECA